MGHSLVPSPIASVAKRLAAGFPPNKTCYDEGFFMFSRWAMPRDPGTFSAGTEYWQKMEWTWPQPVSRLSIPTAGTKVSRSYK